MVWLELIAAIPAGIGGVLVGAWFAERWQRS